MDCPYNKTVVTLAAYIKPTPRQSGERNILGQSTHFIREIFRDRKYGMYVATNLLHFSWYG
jgi:hypothetical protein